MPLVHNTRPTVLRVGGVRIGPGANRVTDAELKAMRGNRVGAAKLEQGVLRVEEEKRTTASNEPSAAELARQVKQMTDPKQLREYAEDHRKTVAQAAQDRLNEVLEAKTEDREG